MVSSTEEKCSSICPFNDSFDLDTPIEEIIMKVLTRDGPSDGVCLTGDKWIMNGTQFGLPSKCICYNIPKGTDMIPFDLDTPIEEIIMKVLTRDGPSDGVCLTGDKWIMNGTQFGFPSKCFCFYIPKGAENGQKCPNHSKASVKETLAESWIRNYELHKNEAPEDGWCLEGTTKWIIESSVVNIPRDVCLCVDGYNWYGPYNV
ncbi:CLUMA_CG000914, isoform A [Clunio marinus]|uniref:CLUMA_CG000914, isoform A n=1 Tax=Clunio marinus TaxID=568069 RepID=A0A1J1HGF4_9DIPT|nr:CLUMA_CG000914, isoform A [Clunio marinus]